MDRKGAAAPPDQGGSRPGGGSGAVLWFDLVADWPEENSLGAAASSL